MSPNSGSSGDKTGAGDLLSESDVGPESAEFKPEQSKQLRDAEEVVLKAGVGETNKESWLIARKKVEQFRPVPWFIWRLCLSAFSSTQQQTQVSEGMVLGLRRLLFAAASDPIIGTGTKVNNTKKALQALHPETLGAVAIIHSVCRRLKSFPNERLWKPIVDEGLVNAQIGFMLGKQSQDFGAGRGMLAGFSLEIGMAVLIATSDERSATDALDRLANGEKSNQIGTTLFGCEPLQVSAMLLAAAGCGQDAACGVGAVEHSLDPNSEASDIAMAWQACSQVIFALRKNTLNEIPEPALEEFGLRNLGKRSEMVQKSIMISRTGHELSWIE